jgi:hypothetical protein
LPHNRILLFDVATGRLEVPMLQENSTPGTN